MKNLMSLLLSVLLISSTTFAQGWESLNSSTDYILFDISFPPGQNQVGYAAGMQYTWDAEGVMVKTTDGGNTWTQIVSGANTIGFEAICFTSPEVGYVGGWDGYFAKTTDGGQTWQSMSAGFENWFFMDIEFFDAENGVALANLNSGSSGIYVTNDAGQTWSSATGINHNVQDLAYADANIVYAVGGDEKISKSTDGGNSWNQIYSGTNQRFFMGCDFNGDFGVVGGEDGKIFSTIDGGASWNTFATGYHNFQGVHVFDVDSAYIGGTDEDTYKTTDWGANWEMDENGAGSSHIYKVKFTDDGTGFLCGSQGMIKRKVAPMIPLMANFEANETDICDGEEVAFADMSTGNVLSWSWAFEGGYPSDSQEPNPTIFYLDAGTYDVSLTVTDENGESTLTMEDYIVVHNCTGIDGTSTNTISFYPNPAQDILYIQGLDKESLIKIIDISGKLVYTGTYNSSINISQFAEGSYFVQIETNEERIKQKFLIKR